MAALKDRVAEIKSVIGLDMEIALIGGILAHEGYFDNAKPLEVDALNDQIGLPSSGGFSADTIAHMQQRFGMKTQQEAIEHLSNARGDVHRMIEKLVEAEVATGVGKTPNEDLVDALFATMAHEMQKERRSRILS